VRLLIVGCEYSGTTTFTWQVMTWAKKHLGAPDLGPHDHFKWPHIAHPKASSTEAHDKYLHDWEAGRGPDPTTHALTLEEKMQLLDLPPTIQEMFMRYLIQYHLQDAFYSDPDMVMVGMHFDEAIYAPLFYGYGAVGQYAARNHESRIVEQRLYDVAPDLVLIQVKATPETIAKRLKAKPHPHGIIKEKDIELVLKRFQQEYEDSSIYRRFTIDTTRASPAECLEQFVENMKPLWTESDRMRMMAHRELAKQGYGV